MILINELIKWMKMDVSVVSVGPYCTSDGDVHNSIGISGNRQNTRKKKKQLVFLQMNIYRIELNYKYDESNVII